MSLSSIFKIINKTTGKKSGEVCGTRGFCLLDKEFTVKQGDELSLFYDFGFDLQVPPNTKVHFVLEDQKVDAKISPPGADRMNINGWVNPNLADVLLPGKFVIYAYDEYYLQETARIILTVESPLEVTDIRITDTFVSQYNDLDNPAPLDTDVYIFIYTNLLGDGEIQITDNGILIHTQTAIKGSNNSGWKYKFSTTGLHRLCAKVVGNASEYCTNILVHGAACLKEGEFNYPYIGKTCCPGLKTGWDLRCTPIITPPEPPAGVPTGYVFLVGNIYFKPNYRTPLGQGILMWDAQTSTGFTRYASDSGDLYALAVAKEGGTTQCQPPDGVQRKCLDASTIGVWNGVDCKYDTAPCSTGRCASGICLPADPGSDKYYACSSGTCQQVSGTTGFKNDPTCQGKCPAPQTDAYYDCVGGICKRVTYETEHKNDPTCGGVCIAPKSDATTTAAILIAASIGAALLLKYKGGKN